MDHVEGGTCFLLLLLNRISHFDLCSQLLVRIYCASCFAYSFLLLHSQSEDPRWLETDLVGAMDGRKKSALSWTRSTTLGRGPSFLRFHGFGGYFSEYFTRSFG